MILLLDDIAGSEILLILVFILIFFGSKSIPGIAKTLGKTIRQIKDASEDIQSEIKKSGGDFKKDLNLDQLHITKIIRETKEEIEKPFLTESKKVESSFSFEAPKPFQVPQVSEPEVTPPENIEDQVKVNITPEAPVAVVVENEVVKSGEQNSGSI